MFDNKARDFEQVFLQSGGEYGVRKVQTGDSRHDEQIGRIRHKNFAAGIHNHSSVSKEKGTLVLFFYVLN